MNTENMSKKLFDAELRIREQADDLSAKSIGTKRATNEDKRLAERIKNTRLELNVKQPDIANNIGVSCQQYQKYENGTNRIPALRLLRIARYLEVPINTLLDGDVVAFAKLKGLINDVVKSVGEVDKFIANFELNQNNQASSYNHPV